MKESDEGVTGQGSGAAESEQPEWVPHPLILQPRGSVIRRARSFEKDDTSEIPVVAEGVVDDEGAEPATVTPTVLAPVAEAPIETAAEPVGEPTGEATLEPAEESETEPVGESAAAPGTSVALILAPSQELVSLRPPPKQGRSRAFWLRVGACVAVLAVVGAAGAVGLSRGQFSGGEVIAPLASPNAIGTNPPEQMLPPTSEDAAPMGEGLSLEVDSATEELIEIPSFMARATPSVSTSSPAETAVDVPPEHGVAPGGDVPVTVPPPVQPPQPTDPPAPQPTEVRAGTVVLSQYSDRNGTFWQYKVRSVPFRGIVHAVSSDGRVDNRSRVLLSQITVKTAVPVSNEKVVWTVLVDNRFGSRVYSETLTTG